MISTCWCIAVFSVNWQVVLEAITRLETWNSCSDSHYFSLCDYHYSLLWYYYCHLHSDFIVNAFILSQYLVVFFAPICSFVWWIIISTCRFLRFKMPSQWEILIVYFAMYFGMQLKPIFQSSCFQQYSIGLGNVVDKSSPPQVIIPYLFSLLHILEEFLLLCGEYHVIKLFFAEIRVVIEITSVIRTLCIRIQHVVCNNQWW